MFFPFFPSLSLRKRGKERGRGNKPQKKQRQKTPKKKGQQNV